MSVKAYSQWINFVLNEDDKNQISLDAIESDNLLAIWNKLYETNETFLENNSLNYKKIVELLKSKGLDVDVKSEYLENNERIEIIKKLIFLSTVCTENKRYVDFINESPNTVKLFLQKAIKEVESQRTNSLITDNLSNEFKHISKEAEDQLLERNEKLKNLIECVKNLERKLENERKMTEAITSETDNQASKVDEENEKLEDELDSVRSKINKVRSEIRKIESRVSEGPSENSPQNQKEKLNQIIQVLEKQLLEIDEDKKSIHESNKLIEEFSNSINHIDNDIHKTKEDITTSIQIAMKYQCQETTEANVTEGDKFEDLLNHLSLLELQVEEIKSESESKMLRENADAINYNLQRQIEDLEETKFSLNQRKLAIKELQKKLITLEKSMIKNSSICDDETNDIITKIHSRNEEITRLAALTSFLNSYE